jgi:hypothetical protein
VYNHANRIYGRSRGDLRNVNLIRTRSGFAMSLCSAQWRDGRCQVTTDEAKTELMKDLHHALELGRRKDSQIYMCCYV